MNRRHWTLGFLSLCTIAVQGCQQKAKRPRVACVGDSITFGLGIENRKRDSYPAQLQAMLGSEVEVKNFGLSGTTILKNGNHPFWTTKAYHGAIEWEPDVVVLKLGTNDTKPMNWEHREGLAKDLEDMIANFQNLDSAPEVFVCLPAPAFPGRWGIKDTVIKNELIPIIRTAAENRNCQLIDLYSALAGKKEFFPDKVHPNKDGAKLIAETVYATIKASI